MLIEQTLWGERDKVQIAIDRLRQFEPPVFRRLPEPYKWDEICVILVHPEHHVPETARLNYECAKMKLQAYGSTAIENFVASVPCKSPIILPDCYYEARMTVCGF